MDGEEGSGEGAPALVTGMPPAAEPDAFPREPGARHRRPAGRPLVHETSYFRVRGVAVADENVVLSLGDPIIPFALKGVDGRIHKPEEYTTPKVLAVAWWCNHCPSVQAWEQRTIDLARAYAARGVQFLLINSNDPVTYPTDDFTHMAERAKAKGYPFPYLYDDTQELAKRYGATRTPEFFVFDAQRVLRYHGKLDDNRDDPRGVTTRFLRDAVEALLAGKAPSPAETPPQGCSVKWKTA